MLTQLQYGIDVAVNDSNFTSNSGSRGGIIIILFTGVNNTHVTFESCLFDRSAMTFYNDVRLPNGTEYTACPSKRDVAVSLIPTSPIMKLSV